MALIHSILMGAVAGMRAMTPLAAVANAACNGTLPAGNGAPRLLGNRLASTGAKLLAAGELAGDKMESAPDRTVAAGMLARIATGAIAGMALAPREQRPLAAALGAAAAVGAAYVTFNMRIRAMQRFGQKSTGAVEDAITVGCAALIARSAAKSSRRFPLLRRH
ncbi:MULTISPECIES: DUF4126 domain-containing protein [Luteimonas]|uniref:DUF4126 domain-containing protein n=1 Tax=Luteimonas chenhongjianii TaxID=2006110 RepID=A0A290XEX3_9GAMM|nr:MULTISPECIES: DUF4126 domain-containing protein [Luteimonas]ATD67568.1 DUF4126 domain-containing protein [Luteimonas chenhongjianii]RPD83629.1 DUF4126 domain-containing protein [Luteimonas sp. 100069]